MRKTTRRTFIRVAGLGLGAGLRAAAGTSISASSSRTGPATQRKPSTPKFELGLASQTFKAFGLDKTIDMTRQLELKRISLNTVHLPLESSTDEIRGIAAKVRAAGLDLYAGGIINMKTDAEVRRAFDYAKAAGMAMIIGVPDPSLLPLVNSCAGEYNIGFAIHNNGPTDKLYATPESAYEKIMGLDRRIGLCINVGQTRRSGIDPALDAVRFIGRLLDVYISDVTEDTESGEACALGRGVADIPFFLRALIRIGYAGTVSLAYETDEKDPLPGATESIAYLRRTLASL